MIETPTVVNTQPLTTAFIHLRIPREEMPTVMGPAVHELLEVLQAQGLAPAGPLFAHHHAMTPEVFDFDLCFPVDRPVTPSGRVQPGDLPAATVARTVYPGAYEGLPEAWGAFDAWIADQGLDTRPDIVERPLVGPEAGDDPSAWRTELNRPLTAEAAAAVGSRSA